jgi:SSS family transporter
MALLDWLVLIITISFIVIYGVWKTRGQSTVDSYVKGNNELPWWTVGLSVMATQASAITFISTPGQAYHDGMGFVQFYFGLPLAMIIICLVFIPIYHKLKIYTAYEYLERRFDLKTRLFAAIIFLLQRGMAAGITIFAPAIILSTILGWDLKLLNVIIGILVIIYTISGGTKAVAITQKHQMAIILLGMVGAFFSIIYLLPDYITFSDALSIAGASDKLNILDFSFDTGTRYTFWSGITGGLFLALAYFGTDQSQVQRYLAAKSEKESQKGLVFNGLLKIPMQFFILLTGVMVFVFYQFEKAPLFFNAAVSDKIETTDYVAAYQNVEEQYNTLTLEREDIYKGFLANPDEGKIAIKDLNNREKELRNEAKTIIQTALPDEESNDKDYVFISFILKYFPVGLVGLLLAVIFSAAMSSTASELNALASTTLMDIYLRNSKTERADYQNVRIGKLFTLMWGVIAIIFANICSLAENLIQFVNIIGSIFYGTVLGLFLIGFFIKYIQSNAVFLAGVITQLLVIAVFIGSYLGYFSLSYLWLNAGGCLFVILLAYIFQAIDNGRKVVVG